jgi:hypothetical protein
VFASSYTEKRFAMPFLFLLRRPRLLLSSPSVHSETLAWRSSGRRKSMNRIDQRMVVLCRPDLASILPLNRQHRTFLRLEHRGVVMVHRRCRAPSFPVLPVGCSVWAFPGLPRPYSGRNGRGVPRPSPSFQWGTACEALAEMHAAGAAPDRFLLPQVLRAYAQVGAHRRTRYSRQGRGSPRGGSLRWQRGRFHVRGLWAVWRYARKRRAARRDFLEYIGVWICTRRWPRCCGASIWPNVELRCRTRGLFLEVHYLWLRAERTIWWGFGHFS